LFTAYNGKTIVLHIDSDGNQEYSSIYNHNTGDIPMLHVISRENEDFIWGMNNEPYGRAYLFLEKNTYPSNGGTASYNNDIGHISYINNVKNTSDDDFIISTGAGIIKTNKNLDYKWIHDFTDLEHESTQFNDVIELYENKYAMISRVGNWEIPEKTVFRIFQVNE